MKARGRRLGLGVALALGIALGTLAIDRVGWLEELELASYDARTRWLARPAADAAPIRLVLVDEASLDARPWPWPRAALGAVIDVCRVAGCRALAFDLLLPDPDLCHGTDGELAQALERARDADPPLPVVLAVQTHDDGGRQRSWPLGAPYPFVADLGASPARDGPAVADLSRRLATFPLPPLAERAAGFGHVDGLPERDATVRALPALRLFDGEALPPLGLATWAITRPKPRGAVVLGIDPWHLTVDDRRLPLDRRSRLWPRFRQPRSDLGGHLYPALPADVVVEAGRQLAAGDDVANETTRQVLADLADRWVIYGTSASALHDNWPTPVAPLLPGAEIQATLLDNLLHDAFLVPAPEILTPLLVVPLAFLALATGLGLRRAPVLGAGRILVALGWLLLPWLLSALAYSSGRITPVVAPTLAAALALLVGAMVGYALEGRQRRYLRRAFEHYLSPVVVERLVREPERLTLGGERRELTLFFSDLAGFSTFSERLDPRQLTALLNDYLGEMTEIILAAEGTLDKYEGDAIVAFWNAPLDQPDHRQRAARVALAMQRRLAELAPRYRERWGVELTMRIGIHSGPVVVGNLGSRRRFDYSVLGDAANLAARLEGANKLFGSATLVSESTWRAAEGLGAEAVLTGREVAELVVVGRSEPTRVFEPLGQVDEPNPSWRGDFDDSLESLRRGDLHQARRGFVALVEEDPVSAAYVDQLDAVLAAGDPWDGVWRPTRK